MAENEIHQHTLTREQWDDIGRRLREPFDPREVDFRVQGKVNDQSGRAQVVAYIDARVVQDRLDAVVGIGNWSFDWTPLVIDKGEVMVAKSTLTIHGVAKSDAGSASNFEQSLGAVSHCFKRAAVHWGIGRYLYNLPAAWVAAERNGRIPDAVLRDLRAKLPRPSGLAPAAEVGESVAAGETTPHVQRPVSVGPVRDATRPRQASVIREESAARSVASAAAAPAERDEASVNAPSEPRATEAQLASIRKLSVALGRPEPEDVTTYARAREVISHLSGEYQRARRAS